MKGVRPDVVVHTIPLREDAKPVKQRPYPMNPKYANVIKEELDKLLQANFIYEIEHTDWVSPIVIVPKKNNKIRVCVNTKKLNAASIRDHYPLPFTEHVLGRIAGSECYSFLDGFSGYNQVQIKLEDRPKTTFSTEWGIYAYRVMPFVLTNAPATFQRLMCTAFKNQLIRKFLEVYMDDLCVHSKWEDHLKCLREVFEQCQLYRISLNPLKCQFMVKHGVVLGHVISQHGISTDETKIKAISQLEAPKNHKGVQVFMGHVG